jgi:pimeloyl-ACP methyl ester carboxylesterase
VVRPVYGRFSSLDGTSIAYKASGEGSPVLLVHGAIVDSARNWSTHLDLAHRPLPVVTDGPTVESALLDAGYQVVMLDRRGHGRSDKPHERERYRMDACVGDVRALVDHLGLDQVALVGYSAGSWIVLRLLHDPWVSASVLAGVGSWAIEGEDPEFYPDMRALAECFLENRWDEHPDEEGHRSLAASIPGSDFAALGQSFLGYEATPAEFLKSVRVPVMVINGGGDESGSDKWDLSPFIPGATRMTAGDGDHMFATSDPLFQSAIVRFLRSN